jgi:nitroreductase
LRTTNGIHLNQLERPDILALAQGLPADTQIIARLLSSRFSCRAFRSDPVPHATIERLLSLAQLSASWCNAQPWHVIVTKGEGTDRFRAAIHEYALANPALNESDFPFPAQYTGIYQARRRETASRLYESVGVAAGDRIASRRQTLENFKLFGAPHVMIISTESDLGTYGAIDCGIFIGSVLLLAESLGLATIPQAALAVYSRFVREHFGLPENRRVVCGISFGYADPDHPANRFRTARAPIAEAVAWVRE